MDHLNIFNPYESKPLNHEDQLTRALLILVKNSKTVELAFSDMIINQMVAAGCKSIPKRLTEGTAGLDVVKTQIWSSTKNELTDVSGRLVSVLITDKKLEPNHRVERTERVAVYDAIIHYKPDWIFVIENKPDHRNVWLDQMSAAFSESFEVVAEPIILTWQEIITRISTIKENALLLGAEASLADDFLGFVADQFPELNPYDRFGLCKGNQYLLDRRCLSLMENSKLGPVDYHRGWHYYIELSNGAAKEIALYPETLPDRDWEIRLALYPGDTINQARHFYSQLKLDKVLQLPNTGWRIRPNFHFAFRSSNLVWTSVSCPLDRYLEFWLIRVKANQLGQVHRKDWDSLLKELANAGMLSRNDDVQIKERIIDTRMDRINICPGVEFLFRWSQVDAIDLDNKSAFLPSFVQRVKECTGTWL